MTDPLQITTEMEAEMRRDAASWAWFVGALAIVAVLAADPIEAQSAIAADGVVESTAGGFKFPDGTVQITASCNTVALVEDTGQTSCWDIDGNPITCTGTGMDGELRRGVAWPTPRLANNGDGTVTDNLTGLMWLLDGNCLGSRDWGEAFDEVAALNAGSQSCAYYTATYTDWRLPNVKELLSLIDYENVNPALPSDQPFENLFFDKYWTSSTSVYDIGFAWVVDLGRGFGDHHWKPFDSNVLAVRGGQ
jgi:hypothetical protein